MLTHVICMLNGPDTFWLNAINILLGAVSVIFLVLIIVAVFKELILRSHGRESSLSRRLRSISLRQLGFSSTDAKVLPDEKDLHPGMIPEGKSKSKAHTRHESA